MTSRLLKVCVVAAIATVFLTSSPWSPRGDHLQTGRYADPTAGESVAIGHFIFEFDPAAGIARVAGRQLGDQTGGGGSVSAPSPRSSQLMTSSRWTMS